MQTTDIREWKQAYEDDPNLKTAIQQLQQGKTFEKFQLTPQGLLAVQKDNWQILRVPFSLRQRIIRKCHNVPSVGHVGMRRTLELVSRQ